MPTFRLIVVGVVIPLALCPVRAAAVDYEVQRGVSAGAWLGGVADLYNRSTLESLLSEQHPSNWRSYSPYESWEFNGWQGINTASAEAFTTLTKRKVHIGATASVSAGFEHPPNSETRSLAIAYVKDTLYGINNVRTGVWEVDKIERCAVTVEVDGDTNVSGNGLVQIGAVLRLTDNSGNQYTDSDLWIYSDEGTHSFHEGAAESPLSFTLEGPSLHDDLSFTFGTVELLLVLNVKAGFSGGIGEATATFANTMKISNIKFFNAEGHVLTDVQLTGALGTEYPYNVPEPLSHLLAGLFVCGIASRRRS